MQLRLNPFAPKAQFVHEPLRTGDFWMAKRVCVIGLGYVGLPLAVELAKYGKTVGLDISRERIAELHRNHDRTNELTPEQLAASQLALTHDIDDVPPCDFCIITVPTPIDDAMQPDLSMVRSASQMAGLLVKKAQAAGIRPIVIYESTVYPGVTEDVCARIIEDTSGLAWKTDFFLGYSPERINPGDREHTIGKITKVVSGDTPETLQAVSALYNQVTTGGVFEAASIRAAEAAKVIENAQRDINIAFMNEITQIFRANRAVDLGRAGRCQYKMEFPALFARYGGRSLYRNRPVLSGVSWPRTWA